MENEKQARRTNVFFRLLREIGPYRKDGSGQEGRQLPETVAKPVPVTGAGSFCFSNASPAIARAYAISRSDKSATGTLSAAAASNAKVVLGTGANWAGTVVWDGGVELTVAADDTPFSYAFGGLRLDEPFSFRLWENGLCDTVDLAREGWTGASGVVFHPAGGLVPEAGDEWILGTMPAGTAPPPSGSAKARRIANVVFPVLRFAVGPVVMSLRAKSGEDFRLSENW